MGEVGSWIDHGRLVEVILSSLNEKYLKIGVCFCEATSSDTSSRSAARKYDINVADGLGIC